MILIFAQSRKDVLGIFTEEELSDLIALEILEEKDDMIKLRIEHQETLLQSKTFTDFMKFTYDKYKNEGRL